MRRTSGSPPPPPPFSQSELWCFFFTTSYKIGKLLLHHAASEKRRKSPASWLYFVTGWVVNERRRKKTRQTASVSGGSHILELPHFFFIRRCFCRTENDMWMIFFGSSCFHLGIPTKPSTTTTSGRFPPCFEKWGSDFTKTQKMARRRSRRPSWAWIWARWERKGQMQQRHEWSPPSSSSLSAEWQQKEVKLWRQMRRSIDEGDLDKFCVAHNEQEHFTASFQIVYTILKAIFASFLKRFSKPPVIYFCIYLYIFFWSGSSPDYSMEVCYQLPVLPLDRPVPKHVLSRRGAISFSSSSSLFGAPDPRQLSQVKYKLYYY